ncbi:hypothetical protein QNH10_08090 [Sporosarcina thermotolerans]|uniref:hypothetical protein n=1 Tax=Sporosarcina thermotolerans TaxID=633404 RepID=UPI0024BC15E9|nr:hypothetical protein [Sporosarcina thermotolerans]WHT49469.1 hypothetical protein QNH10_08090 [Sporosarcina thermotolerans]
MIDYMKFDVMWMDEVIASVNLKPANGGLHTLLIILVTSTSSFPEYGGTYYD